MTFCLKIMRVSIYIVILVVLCVPDSLRADDKSVADSWIRFSAHCQNLYDVLLRDSRSAAKDGVVAMDPSIFEADLEGIDSSLDSLVKSGALESQVIKIKSFDEVGEGRFGEALDSVVEKLTKKFGVWAASEMTGLGEHMRFARMRTDQQWTLHIRLPEEYMKVFVAGLRKHDLIVSKQAEQAAAGDPDNAPN